MFLIFVEYSIDAAHWLPLVPAGHKCGTMHGHRYEIRVEVEGEVGIDGWIMDFAELKRLVDPIVKSLDHQVINDIITNPTCENITLWLGHRIAEVVKNLTLIEVRETSRAGCVWLAK